MEYEFNLLYYTDMYKKWRRAIITTIAISVFFTLCFSLLTPRMYISTATLFSSSGGGASSSVGSIGKFLGLPEVSSSDEIIIYIFKSKRMAKDIAEKFELSKRRGFKYNINAYTAGPVLYVNVEGTDPNMTEKIVSFAITNLDKINNELILTSTKPMVKILDAAVYGKRQSRQTFSKMLVAAIASFLLVSLYAFFMDYFKKLKSQQSQG